MNERIKQLKHQASLWCDMNIPEKFSEDGYGSAWEEKFAELIVRECADLFVDQKYMILNPHEPFANERVRVLKEHDKDTVRTIKGHFGVK